MTRKRSAGGRHRCPCFCIDTDLWHNQADCNPSVQAAMAQHFKVFKSDTAGVLARIMPGTPEAELWQQLVTESIKGRLEDSSGIMVMKSSKRTVQGHYRFFADAAGRQLPRQQCIALTHAAWTAGCGRSGACGCILFMKLARGLAACCEQEANLSAGS